MEDLNRKIKLNIGASSAFQSLTITIGFLIIPLLVDLLDEKSMGIWFTILSFTAIIGLIDLGVSNSLRNKITPLISIGKYKLARVYVSSSFFYFGFILSLFMLLVGVLMKIYDFSFVFNLEPGEVESLNLSIFLVITSVVINIFSSLVNAVAYSVHFASYEKIKLSLVSLTFFILILFTSTYNDNTKLFIIASFFLFSNVFVNIILAIIIFCKYSWAIPHYRFANFSYFKEILGSGVNFVVIGVSSFILLASDNILISQLFSVSDVTQYAILLKILMLFVILQGLYSSSLWSAYGYQYKKGNVSWIRSVFAKAFFVSFVLIIAMIFVGYHIDIILHIWLADIKFYDFGLISSIVFLIAVRLISSNFSTLFNGLGLTSFQRNTAIVASIVNIPLSIFLSVNLELGIYGIPLGSAISLSIFMFSAPIYMFFKLKFMFLS